MSELEERIIDAFGFSKEEFQRIKNFFLPKEIKKGNYFLKEGQYIMQMGVVEKRIFLCQ